MRAFHRHARLALGLALATLAGLGCSEGVECGEGTEARDGTCIPTCLAGTHRDEASGACLADADACVSGQIFETTTGTCVSVEEICAEDTTWVASAHRCVPDETLAPADQWEGDGENDPFMGGPEAYEPLELPAEGATWTIGGRYATPTDLDGDGVLDPDVDFYVFETSGPTLLRVEADAVGGATAGFQVIAVDGGPPVNYLGVGSTGREVTTDVVLPRAGLFGLLAIDGLNLASHGIAPYHGGSDAGYYLRLTRLGLPDPTPLTFQDAKVSASGTWPVTPPADGTAVGVYSITLEPWSVLQVGVGVDTMAVTPAAMVFDDEGTLLETPPGAAEIMAAFDTPRTFTIVTLPWRQLSPDDAHYRLEVEQGTILDLAATAEPTTVDQRAWQPPAPQPMTFVGFRADAGEVVRLSVTSSTPQTCFLATRATFDLDLASFGCSEEGPKGDGELRFVARQAGLYVLGVLGWEGRSREFIPAQSFSFTATASKVLPVAAGTGASAFSAADQAVGPDAPERYYLLDPEAGASVRVRVTPLDGLIPSIRFYDYEAPLPGGRAPKRSDAVWRAPEGRRLLVGVSSALGGSGTFDVRIDPFSPAHLDTVSQDAPLEAGLALAAGESWGIVEIPLEALGMVDLAALPPVGLDVALMPLDANLQDQRALPVDTAASGEAERIVLAGTDRVFMAVRTADGGPVAAETALALEGSLLAAHDESEPNNSTFSAQDIEVPSATRARLGVAPNGTFDGGDFFRIRIDAPTLLTVATVPLGDPGFGSTGLYVWDALMNDVASDLFSQFAHLEDVRLEPGTYLIAVSGEGLGTDGYLLEVYGVPAP